MYRGHRGSDNRDKGGAGRAKLVGTHLMLVGKDGKVANNNAQLAFAAEEIEKLAK